MARIEVGHIKRGSLIVRGGWSADVPEPTTFGGAGFVNLRDCYTMGGVAPYRAVELATEACAELFVGSWTTKMRQFVARAAETHAEERGDLAGFRPERIAPLFMPNSKEIFGRRGNFLLARALEEMR